MEMPALEAELARLIENAYATDREATGAWLKYQLRRRHGEFDESEYGYSSFIDLVRSFSDAISVQQRPGSDFVAELREQTELFSPSETDSESVPYVRPDLWQAFAFVRQDADWVYDREAGTAVPRSNLDDPAARDAQRFVPIPSLEEGELRDWMVDFVDALPDGGTAARLREALTVEDGWLWKFNDVLRRGEQSVQQAWRRKRALAVIRRINEWAEAHDVELVDVVEEPEEAPTRLERELGSNRGGFSDRERVLAILNGLPTSELLGIRLPVGLVLDLDPE